LLDEVGPEMRSGKKTKNNSIFLLFTF
jgi:hypothetical protein